MTTRIDHAAESDRIAEHLGESVIAQEGITDATIIATQLDAVRHAILALAEQQRTANLIAWTTGAGYVPSPPIVAEIVETLRMPPSEGPF